MPLQKPWDHATDLKDTFEPKKDRIIPLPLQKQDEVTVFLDDQLKKGYIRPSKSPQTSPTFFVPKKDSKKHMVQDYWYLNKFTVKNNYPLPLIRQLVDKLQGSKLFTKMDLQWGCNTSGSKKVTNGKLHLCASVDHWNLWSCISDSATPPPHSKQWWIRSSLIWMTWLWSTLMT